MADRARYLSHESIDSGLTRSSKSDSVCQHLKGTSQGSVDGVCLECNKPFKINSVGKLKTHDKKETVASITENDTVCVTPSTEPGRLFFYDECSSCSSDDKCSDALFYCEWCKLRMCKTCCKWHDKTMDHPLIDINDYQEKHNTKFSSNESTSSLENEHSRCSTCSCSDNLELYCDKGQTIKCRSCIKAHSLPLMLQSIGEESEINDDEDVTGIPSRETIRDDAEVLPIHEIRQFLTLFNVDYLCRKYGRKSACVRYACGLICETLKECSTEITRVWPAYKHGEENKIIFVVIIKDDIKDKLTIPPPFDTLETIIRAQSSTNDEESEIKRCGNCNEKRFNESELEELESILRKETRNLINAHSNLNIISASPLKSTNYRAHFFKPLESPSIVFYVHLKGYIPIEEDEFPKQLGGFTTDVREAVFELYSPKNYHENVKMGCLIGSVMETDNICTTGTLGAFIDLPGGNVGCITSAHAILHASRMQILINDKNKTYDPADDLKVFQPPLISNVEHIGYVRRAVYAEGDEKNSGLEAALIEITDTARNPVDANFPEVHCRHGGLTSTERYTSGRFYKKIPKHARQLTVMKYGSETSLTRGAFKLNEVTASIRTSTIKPQENGFGMCLRNQIEMTSAETPDKVFAERGDSGSLVLIAHGGNVKNLQAIGIITGGNNHGTLYMTPIWDILKALGFGHLTRLKTFPNPTSVYPEAEEMDIENNETTDSSLYHKDLEKEDTTQNVSAGEFAEFKDTTNDQFVKIDKTLEDRNTKLEHKIDNGHQKLGERHRELELKIEQKIDKGQQKLEDRHYELEQKIERGQHTLENKIKDTFEDGQRRIESKIEDGRGKTIDDIRSIILNDRKNKPWQCAVS